MRYFILTLLVVILVSVDYIWNAYLYMIGLFLARVISRAKRFGSSLKLHIVSGRVVMFCEMIIICFITVSILIKQISLVC